MYDRLILLTGEDFATQLHSVVRTHAPEMTVEFVFSKVEFDQIRSTIGPSCMLIAFGTGVIVPSDCLSTLSGAAYNIHPASPDYPGRDPHHFAAYDGVKVYGATLHVMAREVDAGAILAVDLTEVIPGASPAELMQLANEAGLRLFADYAARLLGGETLAPIGRIWGTRKTRRQDLHELSGISPLVPHEEFNRRLRATAMPGHHNLHVDLHGHRFRYEGPVPAGSANNDRWREFTEQAYAELLDSARSRYRFSTFCQRGDDRHALWRHDVDHSPHRALRLAQLESERGLVATYFVGLRSPYYNLLEPDVSRIASRILSLGHRIGLHFDAAAYQVPAWTLPLLEEKMNLEKQWLERLLGCTAEAVSFHDPSAGGLLDFDQLTLAGMVNAYAKDIRSTYSYGSDSNGYWRFSPLSDVIESGRHERVHILTHPEWWTPEPMPPRRRIERAVIGRARAVMQIYDNHLALAGRRNIG
jgi:hypothetical protein